MDTNSNHMDGSTSSKERGKLASQGEGLENQESFLSSEFFDDASATFSLMSEIGSQRKRNVNGKEISEGDLEELTQIFAIFDQDNDGQIAASELRNIIGSLGQSTTEAEIMDMVDSIDSDGNGLIEFPEFLAMVNGKLSKSRQREQLQKIFKIFDTDGSNEINAENLKRMFSIFGQDFKEKEIANMFAEADYDQDGKVGLEDFLKMMNE
eukprot:Seg4401.1 transcript_id=Seg4401.1/GoldUCD/mRNA.D3Y31 product=Calmodulin protein_id=Seg4401.1/GoldUCD/D3Y31